jgi:S1-C subfamily serine protease
MRSPNVVIDTKQTDVKVIYYDPIHDYGFLQFDPKALKRTEVKELTLKPELAVVGLNIRVIGNDYGQRLTICEGVLGRVNRNAPEYSGYMDFNTNYIQGSALTSGGSSGSPVIDQSGFVVALNAGSFSYTSVALFLPLEHPAKALQHLIQGEPIPRGTLQTRWTLEAFHECQKLGLPDSWVSTIQEKFPDADDMLVVKSVLPGGPAESKLEEGDVILKVNGEIVTRFSQVTNILDSNVFKDIKMTVQRWTKEIEITLAVDDLHSITPDRYFMISKTTFFNLSYQQAQRQRISVRDSGVLCSSNGLFSAAPGGSLIQSLNGRITKDLDAFVTVFQSIPSKWTSDTLTSIMHI